MRGGYRKGAGRPSGQGKYKESTKPIRIPLSLENDVMNFISNKGYKIPMFSCKVQAGFPSPADDYIENSLDLNEHLIKSPASTFFVKATGDSMQNVGIYPEDILVVDKSEIAKDGKIVIAALDGLLTVKRLKINKSKTYLLSENEAYKPIEIKENQELIIWGVVTSVIHKF
jgi:DNA polymerase V